jgi:hypothetical protein
MASLQWWVHRGLLRRGVVGIDGRNWARLRDGRVVDGGGR